MTLRTSESFWLYWQRMGLRMSVGFWWCRLDGSRRQARSQRSAVPLAMCWHEVMVTLYVRDVSEDVADTLRRRAAEAGQSLSAYVNVELARIAGRPTNAEIVARLKARDRTSGPTSDEIVAAVQAGRR